MFFISHFFRFVISASFPCAKNETPLLSDSSGYTLTEIHWDSPTNISKTLLSKNIRNSTFSISSNSNGAFSGGLGKTSPDIEENEESIEIILSLVWGFKILHDF